MAVFKCKMCGGTMEVASDATVATCEYCGTTQTLPRISSEKKQLLYDRAEHFRSAGDFDKAASLYEQMLLEDPGDAETYWALVLCTYGIEYVEDPASHKRVPTVNRTQLVSIFDDPNYQKAISLADVLQKEVYQAEAKEIDDIQQGILAISRSEKPFDVFICYKESDAEGRRTRDSVIAQDLYYGLEKAGYKTFFSRLTLETKAGTAYEPYIFAALRSARVMVVLGTKPEYFKAVWVRNEWSRYLALMKKDPRKHLIPAWRDMDPYDLPEEFSYLQALDMSRLGFLQDLIAGISKLIGPRTPKPEGGATASSSSEMYRAVDHVEKGLKAVKIGRLDVALQQFKRSMNEEVDNPWAYLGGFLVDYKERGSHTKGIATFDDLCEPSDSEIAKCDGHGYYKNALALANADFKTRFLDKRASIQKRKREQFLSSLLADFEKCGDADELEKMAETLAKTPSDRVPEGYDLNGLILKVKEKRLHLIGQSGAPVQHLIEGWRELQKEFPESEEVRQQLASLLVQSFEGKAETMTDDRQCYRAIHDIRQYYSFFPDDYDREALIGTYAARQMVLQQQEAYRKAKALFDDQHYPEARKAFSALGQYQDASQFVQKCIDAESEQIYQNARLAEKRHHYDVAVYHYGRIPGWKDSFKRKTFCMRMVRLGKGLSFLPLVIVLVIIFNAAIWFKGPRGHWHCLSFYYYPHEYDALMRCKVCGYAMQLDEGKQVLDDEQFFQWCKAKVEEAGDGRFLAQLAQCYLTGKGTAADCRKAYQAMEEGSKRGLREAEELKARYVIEGSLEGERLHWTADHGPYFVTGDLHVGRDSCWVLDPGVLVCFVNPVSITMEAGSSLQAIGEKGKEIIFLSIREDLNPRFLFQGKEVQLDYVWQYAKLQGLPSYQKGGPGPAGGTIIHDAGSYENGWRYLEVDPRDLETFCQFGYCPEEEGLVTSLAFGSGKENTQALAGMMKEGAYTYLGGNVTTFRYASRLALDHQVTREGNVYDDWFLPSMEEMERLQEDPEMMQELKDASLWSSSEASRTQAWALVEGSWQKVMKGKSLQILPFRAF